MKFVTKSEIEYRAAPYGFIATIPAGTPCTPATNLPSSVVNFCWVKPWRGMTSVAKSWHRNYGFLLGKEEVVQV